MLPIDLCILLVVFITNIVSFIASNFAKCWWEFQSPVSLCSGKLRNKSHHEWNGIVGLHEQRRGCHLLRPYLQILESFQFSVIFHVMLFSNTLVLYLLLPSPYLLWKCFCIIPGCILHVNIAKSLNFVKI